MSENQKTVADNPQEVGNAMPDVHRFNAEKLGMPFYVDVGTSVVAIRCTSDHEVIWRGDHGGGGKGWIDEAKRLCAIMNKAAKQPVGNAAKLLAAVEEMAQAAAEIMERVRHKDGLAFNTANYIIGVAKTALASPPRNCDVGTAKEQDARYNELCGPFRSRGQCPVYVKAQGVDHCEFVWAQMPYSESGVRQ